MAEDLEEAESNSSSTSSELPSGAFAVAMPCDVRDFNFYHYHNIKRSDSISPKPIVPKLQNLQKQASHKEHSQHKQNIPMSDSPRQSKNISQEVITNESAQTTVDLGNKTGSNEEQIQNKDETQSQTNLSTAQSSIFNSDVSELCVFIFLGCIYVGTYLVHFLECELMCH